MSNDLTLYSEAANFIQNWEQMKQFIQDTRDLDAVLDIRDRAEALRVYAKQVEDSLELQNNFGEMKLRAERRAGELLGDIPRSPGMRTDLQPDFTMKSGYMETLKENEIPEKTAFSWQSISRLPKPVFEEYLERTRASGGEITQAGMLREARRLAIKTARPPIPFETSKEYRIIYADPPWRYSDKLGGSLDTAYGSAENHYPTMSLTELCALPIQDIASQDAVLFLWVTSPMLPEGLEVIKAWGFTYKACFVWDKVKHNFGHYNSVRHEFLMIATRGKCTPDNLTLFDSVQSIERTDKHSEKPEEFRQIIDSLYTWGRRIELFARTAADNWESWGNEPD